MLTSVLLCFATLIGLILLGLISAGITRLNAVSYQHNQILLFDRRFALYSAARQIMDDLLLNKAVGEETLDAYRATLMGASFIVDPTLDHALTQLALCAQSIQKLKIDLASASGTDERVTLAGRLTAENSWVSTLSQSFNTRFEPYLKV